MTSPSPEPRCRTCGHDKAVHVRPELGTGCVGCLDANPFTMCTAFVAPQEPATPRAPVCNAEREARNNYDESAFCDLPVGHPGSHQQLLPWPETWPAAVGDTETPPAPTYEEAIAVACPQCGAPAGERCKDSLGGQIRIRHDARYLAAAAPLDSEPREPTLGGVAAFARSMTGGDTSEMIVGPRCHRCSDAGWYVTATENATVFTRCVCNPAGPSITLTGEQLSALVAAGHHESGYVPTHFVGAPQETPEGEPDEVTEDYVARARQHYGYEVDVARNGFDDLGLRATLLAARVFTPAGYHAALNVAESRLATHTRLLAALRSELDTARKAIALNHTALEAVREAMYRDEEELTVVLHHVRATLSETQP